MMTTADQKDPTHETDLRRRIQEAMTIAFTRDFEGEFETLTEVQVDDNLLEAQIAYRDLVQGEHVTSLHPAGRAWEEHLLEYGPLFFTDDPFDPPKGYSYEIALGFRRFCDRWETSMTPLG